jgi:hypothetical protein
VVGVPLGLGVPAVVVALVGRVVGEVVGASAGGTVVGRVVGSFVGSRGVGVLVLVWITGVPPDGAFVTGGGGRSHMYVTSVSANAAMSSQVDRRGRIQVESHARIVTMLSPSRRHLRHDVMSVGSEVSSSIGT